MGNGQVAGKPSNSRIELQGEREKEREQVIKMVLKYSS